MSDPRGHGNRHSIRRIATEFGQFFDEWIRKKPSGRWTSPVRELDNADSIAWENAGGTVVGTACFREPITNLGFTSSGTLSSRHTVHIRAKGTNQIVGYQIGPGTAYHDPGVGLVDDGYVVVIGNISAVVPFIGIVKIRLGGGILQLLTSFAGADAIVPEGGIVSLAYQRDSSGGGSVNLSAMIDGKVVATATDATTPYDIATVTDGRPGLYGDLLFPLTTTIGHLVQEWWITAGYQTFEAIPSTYPALNRSLRLTLMDRQRFSNSATPKIKAIVPGLTRCRWTYKRVGGCSTLSARFRYPSASDPVGKSFKAPTVADWETGHWVGGEVVLALPHVALELDQSQTSPNSTNVVWRGRIKSLGLDKETEEINLEAEGLFANLSEVFVDSQDYAGTIRDILVSLISSTAKSGTSAAHYRYDPAKIVGLGSVLDLNVRIEARAISVKAVLDKLAAYLPKGIVWGIDRDGDFFLDQQADPYEIAHVGAGSLSFDALAQGTNFDVALDFGKITTKVTVLGRQDEGEGTSEASSTAGRLSGEAESDRAEELFGARAKIHTDSGIQEAGLAFKVALARLKQHLSPRVSAKLTVSEPFRGLRELYQSLTVFAPRVMVRDSADVERRLRFYDDVASYSMREDGSGGAIVTLPSSGAERTLTRSWLFHVNLKFDRPHPGSSGDFAFLCGRVDDVGSTQYGWGSLWWEHQGGSNGRLWWFFDGFGELVNINVDPNGVGTIVQFTAYRDASDDFFFYDGVGLTRSVIGVYTGLNLPVDVDPWRWFDHGRSDLPANRIDGDVSVRHFWVFDASSLEGYDSPGGTPILDFLARNFGGQLHRGDGDGLLLYVPFREQGSSGATPWKGIQGEEPTTPLAVVTPSVTKSGNTGTPDGDDFDVVPQGLEVGTEKKWGGPWVFDAESVAYDYDARAGQMTRTFTLGEIPTEGFAAIAVLQAQVEKVGDILKRVVEEL